MKRLPLGTSVDHGHALVPPVRQQLPGLETLQRSHEDESDRREHRAFIEKHGSPTTRALECDEMQQHPSRLPLPRLTRNQQQDAEDDNNKPPTMSTTPVDCQLSTDRLEQQPKRGDDDENERRELNGYRPATPAIDQTFSDDLSDTRTNQVEEDAYKVRSRRGIDSAATAIVVQQSGFFRPWKKCPPEDDDLDNNNSNNHSGDGSGESESPPVNKWKVRALLNPFARRSKAAGAPRGLSAPALREPPPEANDADAPDEQARQTESPPPPHASLSSQSLLFGTPHRPTTPVPAPSTLAATTRRSPPLGKLRSRGQSLKNDGEDDLASDGSADVALDQRGISKPFRRPGKPLVALADATLHSAAPLANSNNREEREDFQSFKTTAPKQSKGAQSALRGLKPQQQQQQQAAAAASREATAQRHAALKATPKPKGAVLTALAEIQRKRDERRAHQAEEKQRMQTELEAHGDDTGYKFRRLIQAYRDGLPAFQTQSSNDSESSPSHVRRTSADASIARLSVFVRKRPLSKKELKAKGYDIVSCLYVTTAASRGEVKAQQQPIMLSDGSTRRQELVLHEPKRKVDCSEALEHHAFRFDGVFDEYQDNAQVYCCAVGPHVPSLVYDRLLETSRSSGGAATLTVFAYGQTGSGKTYTMKAIYRHAATDLFARLEACGYTSGVNGGDTSDNGQRPPRVVVGVSFYEIYMNHVNDLLNGRSRLQLLEDGDGTVQLLGLKEVTITSADELLALVTHGEDARATSANAVHDDSSRSHALLRITLYDASSSSTILARLSMVDLAGSERACDTQSDSYVVLVSALTDSISLTECCPSVLVH